jgi:ABC-2 type transport system ATP-binding protein
MAGQDRRDTSPSDIAVELRGVHKRYIQRQRAGTLRELASSLLHPRRITIQALRGIDLVVRRGEIVAYAGPNGAGKSTTIKLLASLLVADEGEVRCLGLDPGRDRLRYVARIGVVFGQRTELYWDHPVSASFEWKKVVWDIPDQRYARMRDTVVELLDLAPLLGTTARELSLGQRMRADLALALLHEPELLLLDEPTLGLDVLARRRILAFLQEQNARLGTTVIVTSHDMAELEQLAGRIVMLHEGEIAFDGDFAALRRDVMRHRVLRIEMEDGSAPSLRGAEHRVSEGARHEYVFDGAEVALTDLVAQADAQGRVVDVENHRPPIDDVVAELYERWQGEVAGQP